MNNFEIEQMSSAVVALRFSDVCQGWEQWLMLSADRHHDSPHCDRELERAHLNKALERDALILDCGDLFDAMQGKFDPRRNMDDVRPEDAGVDYYDRIVNHAAEYYAPYAKNFVMVGRGNHETKVLDHTNTDLTSRLVGYLNRSGGRVITGGYGGWVKLYFSIRKTVRTSLNIKYFHGAGSGGPVTRGVIQTNRQSVYLPDADVIVNGHTHDSWILPIARERLSDLGRVKRDLVWHVRTPGYKNDYGEGTSGFAVEKWMPPKPLGCVWLRLYANRNVVSTEVIQEVT